MTGVELHPGRQDRLLALLAARDQADYEDPRFTRSLLLVAWQPSEFSLADDSVVAVRNGEPLGGVVLLPPGALAFVAPSGEGQGAGSRLLDWAERRAVQRGRDIHRQRVGAANERAHSLLSARDYRQVREVRHMSLGLDQDIAKAQPPSGVSVDPVDLGADAHVLHEADRRMFAENADYESLSYEVFRDEHLSRPGLAPDLSTVARRGDRVVGFTLCSRVADGVGLIDLLAVEAGERRRGLGRALLVRALRGFAAAGLSEARLDVASDNPPALALYAAVGMTVAHRTHVFQKPVTRG
jgi:ribosomal protein S18 acetylase RimI-like enzyme